MRILILLGLMACLSVNAQNPRYVSAMEWNKAVLDTARTQDGFRKVANSLERIAMAEKTEWLPQYYLAFSYGMMGLLEPDMMKKDEYYDKATQFINKADSLKPDNSEVYAVKGMILGMQIQVNPMVRGQEFGPKSHAALDKAMSLNTMNPRPFLLKGQALLYTPPMFGGGKDKAIPFLEQAVDKYTSFKPESTISPTWGEKLAWKMLEEAKKP